MLRRLMVAHVLLLFCWVHAVSADARREIQFPDLPGYQTLKCDFHMHTVFSDGYVWPTVRIDEAWREGLDAIAITDHIEYQPHKGDLPTNHNRPYEVAADRAREKNILLIQGAEITRETPPGHFNAIFLNDIDPLDTPDFFDVFEAAAKQHAFMFWNHPGWKGPEKGRWGEEHATLFEKKQLHGIEVCNGDAYYAYAHDLALEKNLTFFGNSDMHHPFTHVETTLENHRTLTLVFAKQRTLAALREALDAHRTAVWFENQLIGREEYLAPMFDACVHINPPHQEARSRVWVTIENRCELDIELARLGKHGPAKIALPACSTSVVRLTQKALEAPDGLTYSAENFLIAPGKTLTVKLRIPARVGCIPDALSFFASGSAGLRHLEVLARAR